MKPSGLLSVLGVGALLLTSACGSSAKPAGQASAGPSSATPPLSAVPSRAQVTAALLDAHDVPAGYRQAPATGPGGATGRGPNASCSDLAKIALSDKLPGSLFEIDREFDNAAHASISESVAPFAHASDAEAMVKRYAADAATCPRMTVADHGQSLSFLVSVAPKPTAGTIGAAVTLTGTGALQGLVETTTMVLDGSTALGVSAPTPAQADVLTTRAVAKLDEVLTGGTGA